MATWYYYNESGDKIEVTGGQLKGLAKAGMITPETIVETDDGKKARAGKVKGLTFITPSTNEESYGLASPSEPSSPTAPLSETEDVPVDAIPEGEETVIAPPVAAQTVPMPQVYLCLLEISFTFHL